MKSDLVDVSMFANYLKDKGISVSTIELYTRNLKYFLKTNPDIDDYNVYYSYIIESMKYKNKYYVFYILKNYIMFKFSDNIPLRNELIEKLNSKDLHKIRRQKDNILPYKTITDNDIANVLNNFEEEKHMIMFIVQWRTGVRVGDILSLKFNSVNYDSLSTPPIIYFKLITKGGKVRTILLTGDYCSLVYKFIQKQLVESDDDYIFMRYDYKPRQRSKMLTSEYVKQEQQFVTKTRAYYNYLFDFKAAFAKAGLDYKLFSTHYLRRKFARKVFDKYKDIQILKKAMDHVRMDTTLRYLRDSGQSQKDIMIEVQDE